MKVVGLDLSLSSTGYADPSTQRTGLLKPKAVKQDAPLRVRAERVRWLRGRLLDQLVLDLPTHVVVEGPSHGSTGGHEHERGGWWWTAVGLCFECDIEVLVATPTMIKKFATGKGNADKDVVLGQTFKRFPWFDGNNDQADALWAAAMGYAHLGQPIVELPQVHLDALKTWAA